MFGLLLLCLLFFGLVLVFMFFNVLVLVELLICECCVLFCFIVCYFDLVSIEDIL